MGTTPVVINITLDTYRRTLRPFVLKYAVFLRRFHTFSNPGANTGVFVRQGYKQSTRSSLLALNTGKLQRNDKAVRTSAASLLWGSRLKGHMHR
jgi:hypothetical protein